MGSIFLKSKKFESHKRHPRNQKWKEGSNSSKKCKVTGTYRTAQAGRGWGEGQRGSARCGGHRRAGVRKERTGGLPFWGCRGSVRDLLGWGEGGARRRETSLG